MIGSVFYRYAYRSQRYSYFYEAKRTKEKEIKGSKYSNRKQGMRKKPKYKPNRENPYAEVARKYNEANPDDFISDEIAQQIGNRAMRKIRLALLLDGKDIEHSGTVFKISDMPRH